MTSSILARLRLAPAMAGLVLAGAASAASAQALDETDMMRFLVQASCADATGRPTAASPADPGCANRAAQMADSPALYRKHDWPGQPDRQSEPMGYQATDAVLSAPPRNPGDPLVIAQSFDFGAVDHGFGVFDAARGDGGQVIAVAQGSASVFMTEDGAGGRQWFVGQGCRDGSRPAETAWLLFNDDVTTAGWRDAEARLAGAARQGECPSHFGSAYTRYIRASIPLPFLQAGSPAGDRTIDTVVSEHYDMPSIARSNHLERFYLARDLGLVRWERWELATAEGQPKADQLQASGRCPPVAFSTPPPEGGPWLMLDCRTWTNIVPAPPGWTARRLGWTGIDVRAAAAAAPRYGRYR